MTRDRNRGTMRAMNSAAIAAHLPGWRVEPSEHGWIDLVRNDGARVRMTVGGWRSEGRATFRGVYPKFRDGETYYGAKVASITCNASRPPRELAREIARRLLPVYDCQYASARSFISSHDDRDAEATLVASRIAATIGGKLRVGYSRNGDGVHIHGEPHAVSRLVVLPAYGDTVGARVNFTVSDLDPDTAAHVLQIIRAAEDCSGARVAQRVAVDVETETDDAIEPALARRSFVAR